MEGWASFCWIGLRVRAGSLFCVNDFSWCAARKRTVEDALQLKPRTTKEGFHPERFESLVTSSGHEYERNRGSDLVAGNKAIARSSLCDSPPPPHPRCALFGFVLIV